MAAGVIAFAPPIDHPLRYEIVETRPVAGGTTDRSTLVEEARFARDGDGYRLTLRTTGWHVEGSPAAHATAEVGLRPTMGVPLTIRLATDGTAIAVIDGGPSWAAAIAGMRAAAALPGASPARAATVATLAALSPTERDAQLIEAADDIVPATRGHREQDRPQPGGALLRIVEDVEVSPASGLVVHRHRRRVVVPQPGAAAIPIGESDDRLVGY